MITCDNCQNWEISQERVPTRYVAPEDLPALASREGSIGVAFTYTEPLLWFEYLLDALPILRATYGAGQDELWLQRWRIFFLACSELFGFRGGQEWWVTHAILGPRERAR